MPDLNMIYQDMRKTDAQVAEMYERVLEHDRQIEELQGIIIQIKDILKDITGLLPR